MSVSDRKLDRYRLGELSPEEARDVVRELEAAGELHRLEALEAEAEAFLEHYPPGPAVQHLREDMRRAQRAPTKEPSSSWGVGTLGALAMVALLLFVFWPMPSKKAASTADLKAETHQPFIAWADDDIDCFGETDCRAKALEAYTKGRELAQNTDDISSPYLAYQELDRANRLLEKGNVTTLPAGMADVRDLQTRLKVDLDARFNQHRVNFHNFEKRKMYVKMADELDKLRAYFPDERSLYHQWAVEKERKMKDDRVYPARNSTEDK